jgi:hypothetical protein
MVFISCRSEKQQNISSGISMDMDSTNVKIKYSESIFTIPSPTQTLILLRNTNTEYNSELLSPITKSANYTTTFKKSLILGIWGADICYLNLYHQKEIALHYIDNIQNILNDLEITQPFKPNFFNKIEENFGNNDSIMNYLSELNRKCDEYLKYNDRGDIGALIITGGWMESFFILSKLYSQTNDKKLFTLILYQKEIINNLIQLLSPLYKKSAEYTALINDLTDIAYEFDVVDSNNSIYGILTDSTNNQTFIKNKTEFILTGSQLEGLYSKILKLRKKYI